MRPRRPSPRALVRYLDIRRGSVIYLIPVLLAGWHLGLVPALVAAAAGVLWSGYLFYSPYYSYFFARPFEILNLALFMIVAVVTSHLANSMKRQTEIARKRENEMSDLYAFSRRLAAAPSAADIYLAIEQHLANLVQRKVVLFGPARGDGPHAGRCRGARRPCASDCRHPARFEGRDHRSPTAPAPATPGWFAAYRNERPISG